MNLWWVFFRCFNCKIKATKALAKNHIQIYPHFQFAIQLFKKDSQLHFICDEWNQSIYESVV